MENNTSPNKSGFLKENFLLVLGLMLPLILAGVFIIATLIPGRFIEPPKYDALFLTNYYSKDNYDIKVDAGKVKVFYKANQPVNGNSVNYKPPVPEINRYKSKDSTMVRIVVPQPPDSAKPGEWVELDVPELKPIKIVVNQTSPDGYILKSDGYGGHGGIMGELMFGGGYRDSGCYFEKDGKRVKVPKTMNYYSCYDKSLLGWITGEE